MKPKQIIISILAVLIVFPVMGTFAQQAAPSGSSEVVRGFVRFSDGSFSAPIVDPNDTVGFTEGRGINNPRTVVGDYVISDGTGHSFLLSGSTFTEYDVPGAVFTAVLGINNPGDFTGTFSNDDVTQGAFVSVGGTLTLFSVPAAPFTLAYD